MLRGTAATRLSIDYFSEQDFVRKMRAASLLTPFFVLLSDNAPVYQTSRNSAYGISARVRQDVDRDRCGVIPHLMDPDFGFARYAETVLTKPQIVAWRTEPRQGGRQQDRPGVVWRAHQPAGGSAGPVDVFL